MRMQAVFEETVIADSDDTVVVEGNHYFPEESLRREHSAQRHHEHLSVEGQGQLLHGRRRGSGQPRRAWTYPKPTFLARKIKGHFAFWNGVEVRRHARTTDERAHRRRGRGWPGRTRPVCRSQLADAGLDVVGIEAELVGEDRFSGCLSAAGTRQR